MINVLHVTAGISRQSAGVSAVLKDLVTHTDRADIAHNIVAYTDEFFEQDRPGYEDVPVLGVARKGPPALGLAPDMLPAMQGCGDVHVVHAHGLWTLHGYYARRFAVEREIPLVISPHGMLEPWALGHSTWKKKIVRLLYENRNLSSAACIHAASKQEARNISELGISSPIAVVPFGLNLADYSEKHDINELDKEFPDIRGRRVLLFMSRIHPKKGALNLAEVWGRLYGAFPDWCLVIAGPSEIGHEKEVRASIARSGAERATVFAGPVHGQSKARLLVAAELFVLPSYSENFGVVVAEALASGCPVITTVETPWEELAEQDCGWWIPTGIEALQDTLRPALECSSTQLRAMGDRGRNLVRERYSSMRSAERFAELYSCLGKPGTKIPSSIFE